MTFDALAGMIPRPKNPTDPGLGKDWIGVEEALGTALPIDYKEFVNLYGTGLLSNHLWVYNPFSSFRDLNLVVQTEAILKHWRQERVEFGDSGCPYPLYPDPDGLLPWGCLDTGSQFFWQTSPDPEQWTVVVSESRGPQFEHFDDSMSGFLVSLFSGRLTCEVLPENFQRKRRRVSFSTLEKLLAEHP